MSYLAKELAEQTLRILAVQALIADGRSETEATEKVRRYFKALRAFPPEVDAIDRDAIIEECALLCEGFQVHYSELGYGENERTAYTLAQQIRAMKIGGARATSSPRGTNFMPCEQCLSPETCGSAGCHRRRDMNGERHG